jgi:hypothetical protein
MKNLLFHLKTVNTSRHKDQVGTGAGAGAKTAVSALQHWFIFTTCVQILRILKNNEKGEVLQTNLQPFTYLYCNNSSSRQL